MSIVKKTHKEFYNEILAVLTSKEHKDFIQSRITAIEKKSASKKETEKQTRNTELANGIYEFMCDNADTLYTITDIMKSVECLQNIDPLSNQFVTNLVTSLKNEGKVERVVEKGRAKFKAVIID